MTWRCITCADESETPRCTRCAERAVTEARASRVAEGEKVMSMVGVPQNLLTARLDRDHYSWVGWRGKRQGVVFVGPPGVGKSWLAAGLVRRRLWQLAREVKPECREWWLGGGGVRFSRTDAMLQHIRNSAFRDEAAEVQAVERWSRCRWLVLDDLGAEKRSEWGAQTLHSLLSHREGDGLVTVVTTNFDAEDLREMYADWGGPIVSRLNALCEWTRVEGKDRRLA
jgi:DNA replication protein DnaC